MTDCRHMRRLLERAFDGRATLDEEFWIEEHARVCATCRDLEAAERALREGLAALPSPPAERLDVERSLAAIAAGIERAEAPRPRASWIPAVAAAAVLLAVIAVAVVRLASAPTNEVVPVAAVAEEPAPSASDEHSVSVELPAESTGRSEEPLVLALLDATDVDPARLAAARARVRAELVRAADAAALSRGELDAGRLAEAFAAGVRPLEAAGWPVMRHVERIASDEDARVARAALRVLGRRGSRSSMVAVREALDWPDVARAALRALIDAGDAGLEGGLRVAVLDPALRGEALEHVAGLPPETGVAWIGSVLGRAADHDLVADCLPALARAGEPGARALLGLSTHPAVEREALLDALAACAEAGPVVVRATEDVRTHGEAEFLLAAIGRLRPEGTRGWVEERCQARVERPQALRVLARFEGIEPLLDLIDLHAAAGGVDVDWLAAWRVALETDSARCVALVADLERRGDETAGPGLLEALVLSGNSDAVPALVDLAGGMLLGRGDRERAILAAAELGRAEHARDFVELGARLDARDRDLAAACLLALVRLVGEEPALELLEGVGGARRARLRAVLADARGSRGDALLLFRLARELEPVLAARPSAP